MPGFNLRVPKSIGGGIDASILMPVNTWKDKEAYNQQAKKLASLFIKNFEKYSAGTPAEVV